MVAFAHRVEADLLINPKSETKSSKKDSTVNTAKTSSSLTPGDPDSDYEVRDMRLYCAVRLHQDPSPGKTKGRMPGAKSSFCTTRVQDEPSLIFTIVKTPRTATLTRNPYATRQGAHRGYAHQAPVLKLNQITDVAQADSDPASSSSTRPGPCSRTRPRSEEGEKTQAGDDAEVRAASRQPGRKTPGQSNPSPRPGPARRCPRKFP